MVNYHKLIGGFGNGLWSSHTLFIYSHSSLGRSYSSAGDDDDDDDDMEDGGSSAPKEIRKRSRSQSSANSNGSDSALRRRMNVMVRRSKS